MQIEQALMTYLLAQSGLTNLVGDRIYHVQAPQNVEGPYLVCSKVAGPRAHSHDGASGLANPRFQLDVFAGTYEAAKEIAAQVQTALQGYTGTMGGAGGVSVNGCFYEDENDFYEPETKLYNVTLEFSMWHVE